MIEKFPQDSLSNLHEKVDGWYVDVETITDDYTFNEVAKYCTDYIYESLKDFDGDRIDFSIPDELSEKLGVPLKVTLYMSHIHGDFLDSNFMYFTPHMDDGKNTVLWIDIYHDELFNDYTGLILMELSNFVRDTQFVLDGVYEEELEKMLTGDFDEIDLEKSILDMIERHFTDKDRYFIGCDLGEEEDDGEGDDDEIDEL